ncbi:MAG TPA: penicillin-binding transpeptidase domain-containing protein [Bryobacteraceae bacterium]|jgi:cell division protein FtsI/penicillin-binding protein 2|nr:penicillin-binding transpeptidase domain-containing protein [Bryobacteraceae bacterium]
MYRIFAVSPIRATALLAVLGVIGAPAWAATAKRKHRRTATATARHAAVVGRTAIAAHIAAAGNGSRPATPPAPIIRGGPWTEPTYADSTAGDFIDGEDLTIRKAAVDALGPYNGSVVVVDPQTGRILTMVNQRVALGSGFQPCSTIKLAVALAGLRERMIDPVSKLRLAGLRMDLTYALAHSNNYFFATLGTRLGYEKVSYYAHLFGYGERAGLNINGEQPGSYPPAPPKNGGVGMLTSFGEEIQQTPLQLAALLSAIANGGTLYYLQYPRSQAEARNFAPKVKRELEIGDLIPLIKPGMRGAVEFGTAHRARDDGPIAGKTGTCSENHTHLGWFGSFNDIGNRKLVVVVLLTGGRPVSGPAAAGIAGDLYRRLNDQNYFASNAPLTPASLISTQICCK